MDSRDSWDAAVADLDWCQYSSGDIVVGIPSDNTGSPFRDEGDAASSSSASSASCTPNPSVMRGSGRNKRSPDWSEEETTALVNLWADDYVQSRFSSMGRNKPVWEEISRSMSSLGYCRSYEKCKAKMDNLKAAYRKIKDQCNETGQDWKFFPNFETIDKVLGDRPTFSPEAKLSSGLPPVSSDVSDAHGSPVDLQPGREGMSTERADSSSQNCAMSSRPDKKKGVKRSRQPGTEKARLHVEFLDEMAKMNKQFIDLEEKRMKAEEEKEGRLRDWQAEQDQKQDAFLMKLLSTMTALVKK